MVAIALEVTTLDLCASAVTSQKNLLADAKLSATRAGAARLDAELKERELARLVDLASQAAAVSNGGDAIDELVTRRTKLDLAGAAHREAIAADDAARARVVAVQAKLADAERLLEVETLRLRRSDGTFEAGEESDAQTIVSSVAAVREALRRHRERLDADGALARRMQELGARDVELREGSVAAGHFAAALLAEGGRMPVENPFEVKWAWDAPQPTSPLLNPIAGAMRLVSLVFESLDRAEQRAKAGNADYGKDVLEAMVGWKDCPNIDAVRKYMADADRRAVKAREERDRTEHEVRLASAKANHEATKGRSFLDGKPIPIRRDVAPEHRPFVGEPSSLDAKRPQSAPVASSHTVASTTPTPAAPAAKRRRGPHEPSDVLGDYALEGSVDAGASAFPTTPDPSMPKESHVHYNPQRSTRGTVG